ncbi:MAG: enoyl-CoA hydratase, partial [Polyangiaceae bacterium]|nr:enoyl-CoA hydratase [Polyangiaceae bacterium]
LAMGLANRVVKVGTARSEAEALAREIAALPQICMRGDRRSAYEQFDLSFEEALANEWRHGMRSLESGALEGALHFAASRRRNSSE